jgi:tetratricopeptide (TPR) repeat protein
MSLRRVKSSLHCFPSFGLFCWLGSLGSALFWNGLLLSEPASEQLKSDTAARMYLANGRRALEAKDLQTAKGQFELAVKANPEFVEAHLALGIAEFQGGDTAAAIQRFRTVLELEPSSFQGHYHLALAYLRDQRLIEGSQELERALAINPGHADAAYNLGVVLLELGRSDDGLKYLRQANAIGPGSPDLSFNLVRGELANHHFEQARQEANAGAKMFGADPTWRAAVGRIFLEYGQLNEATANLAEALRLRPQSEEIRRQLATAYLRAKKPGSVLPLVEKGTTAEDHYLAAGAYFYLHRLVEADRESRRALEKESRDPRYLLQRARIDQRMGRHLESLDLLQQVSQIEPQWAEAHYSAGVSYYLLRRYADVRHSLDRALELDPNSVRALFLYSAALANEGKNRVGEDFLLRAIAGEPANARFYYHLGAIRLRDNRETEAQQAFEQAIRLKLDYAPPHYQLGKLFERSNQLKRAIEELEIAVRYQPDLAQAFYHLGRVYNRLGEKEKSEKALSTFRHFKQQPTTEDAEFVEGVQQELQRSDQ